MRQPHAMNSAGVITVPSTRNSPLAAMNPIGAPSCGTMPYRPRQPGGAFSTANNAAPPHSPPSPKPCPKRSRHSRIGAQ